jgi:hypothetical protein
MPVEPMLMTEHTQPGVLSPYRTPPGRHCCTRPRCTGSQCRAAVLGDGEALERSYQTVCAELRDSSTTFRQEPVHLGAEPEATAGSGGVNRRCAGIGSCTRITREAGKGKTNPFAFYSLPRQSIRFFRRRPDFL